jgi:OOP family OmpA-OmpF porin
VIYIHDALAQVLFSCAEEGGWIAAQHNHPPNTTAGKRGVFRMKKLLILFATTMFLISASYSFAGENGWYAGLSVGQASIDTGVTATTGTASLDEEDTAFKLFAGYEINKYIAVEAYYLNAGEASLKGNNGDTFVLDGTTYAFTANNASITAEAISYGLSGVFTYPLHQYFAPFAKLGFQKWDADFTVSAGGSSLSASDDGTGALFGIGFRMDFTDNISARAEFERYDFDEDVDVITAGILYRF